MQVALCVPSKLLPLTPTNTFAKTAIPTPKLGSSATPRCPPIKATTSTTSNFLAFNYNSAYSVFPAEACETIGGDACMANMYPEVKLKPGARNNTPSASMEAMERDYLEYNEAKTVFKGEACDDLGGMFCDRDYQKGVY